MVGVERGDRQALRAVHQESIARTTREGVSQVDSTESPLPQIVPYVRPVHPVATPTLLPDEAVRSRPVLVGDPEGRQVVARFYAADTRSYLVLLPDGRLGVTETLVPTDAPFRPITSQSLQHQLLNQEFGEFHAHTTAHYVVLSSGTRSFAESTARLLESLYQGLITSFRKCGMTVHEAEFPLVAIIDRTERMFRSRGDVPAEAHAYYDPLSNRIHLFETRDRDLEGPELAALRQPQTVAHEGTHQVLQNIGIQPRLASWPVWLTEGLAEFCAPTTTQAHGQWAGFRQVNPLHMATLRDLDDPLSHDFSSVVPLRDRSPARRWGRPTIEEILGRTTLEPTDYAVAWALTHYLATRRPREFLKYLAVMGKLRPLESRTTAAHLALFRSCFGPEIRRLDHKVRNHTLHLRGYPALPYYAVLVDLWHEDGGVTREAFVSQSPALIHQWLQDLSTPETLPSWPEIWPHPTRASALLHARLWIEDAAN
jgi:hypothetical protein